LAAGAGSSGGWRELVKAICGHDAGALDEYEELRYQ